MDAGSESDLLTSAAVPPPRQGAAEVPGAKEVMRKEEITLPDGRHLVYYTFDEASAGDPIAAGDAGEESFC